MDTTRTSLLARVRDPRDNAAWTEFDGIYRPILARYAAARGLSPADVDDVVQHCMAALVKHMRSFEYDPGKGSFRGFLKTIVNNHIRDRNRARREHRAKTGVLDAAPDPAEGPADAFERECRRGEFHYCFKLIAGEFKPIEADIFRMRFLSQAAMEEVCSKFGVTREYVDKLGWRIRRRLREAWLERFGEEAA